MNINKNISPRSGFTLKIWDSETGKLAHQRTHDILYAAWHPKKPLLASIATTGNGRVARGTRRPWDLCGGWRWP